MEIPPAVPRSGPPSELHTPVMVTEVLDGLITTLEGCYVDGTVGTGGHCAAIAARLSPMGRILGLDLDPESLALARARFGPQNPSVILRQSSFARISPALEAIQVSRCQGVLLDLGLSGYLLTHSQRGFSFSQDGPLDMRFDPAGGRPLATVLPALSVKELQDIIWRYGEERHARAMAVAIHRAVQAGRIGGTGDLAAVLRRAAKGGPVTKTLARVFQALRIYVNDELGALKSFLDQLAGILERGRRAVIISYHSLEDRLVKQHFARESKDCICPPALPACVCEHTASLRILTPKPITPSAREKARNPASRSAKLRVAERI